MNLSGEGIEHAKLASLKNAERRAHVLVSYAANDLLEAEAAAARAKEALKDVLRGLSVIQLELRELQVKQVGPF
jgi:hypothetical protein